MGMALRISTKCIAGSMSISNNEVFGGEYMSSLFPCLGESQVEMYRSLLPLYREWNQKINVISRKDIDNLFVHHVMHSCAIAKVVDFLPGSRILDVGTGGGFPGIPLAIMFPEVEFHLVDSIGKKIKVVQAVSDALGLKNVKAEQCRAETLTDKYDFIVSRAVTRLPEFYPWVEKRVSLKHRHDIRNGILYLKGGDLQEELAPFGDRITSYDITRLYGLSTNANDGTFEAVCYSFFETKKVIYMAF